MAELILRPINDAIKTSHSCSSGSTAYILVNEEVADDDSTYIYQTLSTDSASAGSWFNIEIPDIRNFKLLSFETCARAKATSKKSSDTKVLIHYLYINGKFIQLGIYGNLSDKYTNFYRPYDDNKDAEKLGALIGKTFEKFSDTGITGFGISTSGVKGASKNDDFEMRVTQAWLKITYEEVLEPDPGTSTSIYLKQNGAYAQAKAIWKKTNGVWVKQTDTATLKNEMKNMNLKASN